MSQSEVHASWSHADPIRSTVRGALLRIALSIFIPIAWIGTTLLFLAFWAGGFTLVQDITVFVVSMMILFGTIVAMWISFGVKQARYWTGW
jgi:hypothetical protein